MATTTVKKRVTKRDFYRKVIARAARNEKGTTIALREWAPWPAGHPYAKEQPVGGRVVFYTDLEREQRGLLMTAAHDGHRVSTRIVHGSFGYCLQVQA